MCLLVQNCLLENFTDKTAKDYARNIKLLTFASRLGNGGCSSVG